MMIMSRCFKSLSANMTVGMISIHNLKLSFVILQILPCGMVDEFVLCDRSR